jgi:AcrR family transcriptional regulator
MATRGATAERLMDVAEQLFAEHGYEGTTLRAVVNIAGVNLSAVKYHHQSKDGLLRAVVARAMAPVNAERDRRLAELENRDVPPTTEEVVRAFVEPGLRIVQMHGERGQILARLVGGVVFEPGIRVRQLVAEETTAIADRCVAALCRAMPTLSPAAVLLGYTAMVGLLAQHQAGISAGLHRRGDLLGRESEQVREQHLIRFIVAGFTNGLQQELR